MISYLESLQICRRITKESRSNFVTAFRFLPAVKREGMEVLYAFMRRTDDLADGDFCGLTLPDTLRRDLLQKWRTLLEASWKNDSVSAWDETIGETAGPESESAKVNHFFETGCRIFPALYDVGQRFQIPLSSLLDVIDGVSSDLAGPVRWETEDGALLYCDRVAGAVGIAVLAVLGTNRPLADPKIQAAALACGRAFQWTNFLRDLREDLLERGRLYFPLDDFRALSWRPEDLWRAAKKGKEGRSLLHLRLKDSSDPLTRFLEIQFERTERFYRDSWVLNEMILADSLPVFQIMRRVYYSLFQKMSRHRELIFEGKIRLSFLEKMKTVFGARERKKGTGQ